MSNAENQTPKDKNENTKETKAAKKDTTPKQPKKPSKAKVDKDVCFLAFSDFLKTHMPDLNPSEFIDEYNELLTQAKSVANVGEKISELEIGENLINEKKAIAQNRATNEAKQTLLLLRYANDFKENYPPDQYDKFLLHILGGTLGRRRKGSFDSVSSAMTINSMHAEAAFIEDLNKAGLMKYIQDKRNFIKIVTELENIRDGGKRGITGDELAQQCAEIMHNHQEAWRQTANAAGAHIEALPGYIIAQTHDIYKIKPRRGETLEQGFKRWRDDIKPLLDINRTRANSGGRHIDAILKETYLSLVSGTHLEYTNGIAAIKGGSNRADRLSNHRKLIFKNGEAFYKYNQMYGVTQNLFEGYIAGITKLARNAALMDRLGVNPEHFIMKLHDIIKLQVRKSGDLKALVKLEKAGNYSDHLPPAVHNLLVEVLGKTKVPANETAAVIMQTIRALNSMARLGMATISSFSDIGTQMSYIMFLGMNKAEGLRNLTKMLMPFVPNKLSEAEKQVLNSFCLIAESLNAQLYEAISVGGSQHGWIAKSLLRFFRLNGLDAWTKNCRKAMALTTCHELGEFFAKGANWDKDLAATMKATLEAYHIGPKEIELLKHMELINDGNRHFIDANKVAQIADEHWQKYIKSLTTSEARFVKTGSPSDIARAKEALAQRLRMFVMDQAATAVMEPNVRIQSMMHRGTQVGTFEGEFLRSVGQFKSFPLSVIMQIISPWITASEKELSLGAKVFGLGNLLMTTTALGYIAMSAKDILRGKTPMELSPKSVVRAMLQGGALGIIGDLAFSDVQSESITKDLAGPVFGMVDDVFGIYSKIQTGIIGYDDDFDFETFAEDNKANFLKRMRNYIPGQNLFWLTIPLNYLILHQLYENVSPGYLNRMETNTYNKTGQEYWLPPDTFVK